MRRYGRCARGSPFLRKTFECIRCFVEGYIEGWLDGLPYKNSATDALARRVAALKKASLTEAVHLALTHELEREAGEPSLVEIGVPFCRELRAKGRPTSGKPADKAFRDSLYE